jgi:predicted Zn finger-like uncharacterized protein
MYTRCPHCLTVFVVAAEQLKAAHGNVRCGTCLESFDAIPHLSDGPAQAPPEMPNEGDDLGVDIDVDIDADEGPDIGDTRTLNEQLTSTLDAARAAASTDEDAPWAPPSTKLGDDLDDSDPDLPPADGSAAVAGEHYDTRGTARLVPVLEESRPEIDPPLPDVLREDAAEFAASNAARRRSIGYGIAGVALLVLLAGQYVFFMPEDATRRYPQWRGAIESLCVQIGCVLPERRDLARIRVISRSVRVHPRLEGVMQIKATLTNAAPYRQPYPQVRFTLFNVNGQTIATRDFQPSEYLGRRVAASARLRPQTLFQVELDVLAPEEAAVSFEFQFL